MDNVANLRPPIEVTIDGGPYIAADRGQPARDLLRLGGHDHAYLDLGELKGHRPDPSRVQFNRAVLSGKSPSVVVERDAIFLLDGVGATGERFGTTCRDRTMRSLCL